MSGILKYEITKTNEADAYGQYGFLLGGRAVRLVEGEPRKPNVKPEPMQAPARRRTVRLAEEAREPDPKPVVKSDGLDLDNLDLSELEAWLSGEDDPGLADPEPEPAAGPPQMIELDRRPTFVDLLLAQHGRQDVRQAEPENSFVTFLRRNLSEKRKVLLDMVNHAERQARLDLTGE